MRTIYISLPISGRDETEVRERAQRLREAAEKKNPDAVVITPFDLTDPIRARMPNMTYSELMAEDIAFIIERTDKVMFAWDYYKSKGCTLEWQCAKTYDKEIAYFDIIDEED